MFSKEIIECVRVNIVVEVEIGLGQTFAFLVFDGF